MRHLEPKNFIQYCMVRVLLTLNVRETLCDNYIMGPLKPKNFVQYCMARVSLYFDSGRHFVTCTKYVRNLSMSAYLATLWKLVFSKTRTCVGRGLFLNSFTFDY